MKRYAPIIVVALFLASCNDAGTETSAANFNLKFSYGVGAKNVLNTFDHTYTKDLVVDSVITVPFYLPDSQMQAIRTKMQEIGFFDYPDTFTVATGDTVTMVVPYSTYIFDVTYNGTHKHLYWSDSMLSLDSAAVKLRDMIRSIQYIIISNPTYKALPPALGGYD